MERPKLTLFVNSGDNFCNISMGSFKKNRYINHLDNWHGNCYNYGVKQ